MVTPSNRDFLFLQLRELPYFRALLRAVEATFYQGLDLPAPTLDLGCGDGHFAARTFDRPLEVGLDPWWAPLQEARRRYGEAYRLLVQADGAAMPFPEGAFASAVSNSVLEHIPHLDAVLRDLARVLRPGAPFVFSVPNHNFLPNLSVGRALDRLGLRPLGDAYRAFFNRISRHHHCDPPEVWRQRLARAGFEVVDWWHYFSPAALRALEWGHYFGLPGLVVKKLTGRWILAPTHRNLAWLARRLRPLYENPRHPQGAYTFYIARRWG
ncbi:MAG TPA: class I SAM-dependent methyltransferase [Anaerolineae bacterium]|nr:class I SAM-dependent methyltransferase [Anaerolineae bacterium]HID85467.1 class I SAM-dependent methyltransferase [Anaerolineales bacterium]HIQ09584.1 class I SAM-dependent methyltransferase [Anaerolineaceae bacterium]